MPVIHVLAPNLANQIAAGEVVERPSSVVKELTENAVDAGATGITVEIENGGLDLIRVIDNGCGIRQDEAEIAFLRHATSKIEKSEDLFHIGTLGFRGEALASIAAVSSITMTTCAEQEEMGSRVTLEDGKVIDRSAIGCAYGTSMEVRGLFASVPARLKFLKNPRTEAGYIADYLARMMMARPDIAFTFRNNGKTVYQTFGDNKLINVLLSIYGTGVLAHLGEVAFDDGYLKIVGYIGDADLSKPNRSHQSFFINGRYIRSFALSGALGNAFDTRLMIGRFPFAVLQLTISPTDVDVNVHPTKMEVRFIDEGRVARSITAACADALHKAQSVPTPVKIQNLQQDGERGSSEEDIGDVETIVLPPRIELRQPTAPTRTSVREGESTYRPAIAKPMGTTGSVQRYAIPQRRTEPLLYERPVQMEQPKIVDAPYTMVGCLFDTYWIVQQNEDIFYIDQHAAHERRLYERLMNRDEAIVSQNLLTPKELSLQPLDFEILKSNQAVLEEIGYRISCMEPYQCKILAVPQVRGEALPDRFLFDALHQISQLGKTSDKQLVRLALTQTACKHAIKAGEKIDRAEIDELISYFQRDGAPLTCPHGRPVMIRVTKLEIEKMFKRVL